MGDVRLAQAADGDWGQLAGVCVDQLCAGSGTDAEGEGRLGFLYVTDPVAGDLSSIITVLRARTGVPQWIGTVGIGVCATGHDYFDRPAAVAMTLPLPADSFRLTGQIADEDDLQRAYESGRFSGLETGFGVVHGDPRNPRMPALLAALSRESSCFLVGGLSASRGDFGQVGGDVSEGGLSGALFSAGVPVATGLSQGCAPIGPTRQVSAGEGRILQTLDGRPALETLEEDLSTSVASDKFPAAVRGVHVAVAVAGSDTGDYLVRNLAGLDPQRGWLAVDELLEPGARVTFCRRDPESAEADLRRMLEGLRRRAGATARAGVYHSCLARGPNLFVGESRELEIIGEELGPVPLVGFFGNGEFCHDRIYGYTGVLTLFL